MKINYLMFDDIVKSIPNYKVLYIFRKFQYKQLAATVFIILSNFR